MVKRRKLDHEASAEAQPATPLSAAAALRARRQRQTSEKSESSNDTSASSSPAPEKTAAADAQQKKKTKAKTKKASNEKDASRTSAPKPLSAVEARRKALEAKNSPPEPDASQPLSAVEARRKALEAAAQAPVGSAVHESDGSLDSYEPDYIPRPEDGDDSRFPSTTTLPTRDADLNAIYPPPVVELSSWTPEAGNVLKQNSNGMVARIAPGQTFANVGIYDILVKRGVITLYGAILRAGPQAQPYRVFAPASHALPVVNCLSPDGAELELKSVSSQIGSLEKLSPLHGRLWKADDTLDQSFLRNHKKRWSFENIHKLSDDALERPLYHLEISPRWHQAIDRICSAASKNKPGVYQRILVCGPKSTGKSTFTRMLLNRIFTIDREAMKTDEHSIFLLDLDPGQPEYSAPGQISLIELRQPIFGPPFAHPSANTGSHQRTIRTHFIGANSPKDNPEHFIECAVDLIIHYHKHLTFGNTRGPVVINSPGWVIGTGLQILTEFISRFDLTDVIYTTDEPGRTLDALRQATASASVDRFQPIPSQPSGTLLPRSAAEFRDMQMLSYFHLGAPQQGSPHQSWDTTPLTAQAPYTLSYAHASASSRDFLGIMPLGEALSPATIPTVLNGAIIGIVHLDTTATVSPTTIARTPAPESLPYVSANSDGSTYRGNIEPPSPLVSQLVSLALVRGIDAASQTLHVLVPAAHAHLIEELAPERTLLVLGTALDAPAWAYLEDVHLAAAAQKKRRGQQRKQSGGSDNDGEDEYEVPEEVSVEGVPWVQKEASGEGAGVMGGKRRLRRFVN